MCQNTDSVQDKKPLIMNTRKPTELCSIRNTYNNKGIHLDFKSKLYSSFEGN